MRESFTILDILSIIESMCWKISLVGTGSSEHDFADEERITCLISSQEREQNSAILLLLLGPQWDFRDVTQIKKRSNFGSFGKKIY